MLLETEVFHCLPHHGEDGEEGERRTEHDALAQRLVRDARVLLVNESVDLLVGDEDEHVIECPVAGIDVIPGRDFLDPLAYVREEFLGSGGPAAVRVRLKEAQVAGQRELHIHVQHPLLR